MLMLLLLNSAHSLHLWYLQCQTISSGRKLNKWWHFWYPVVWDKLGMCGLCMLKRPGIVSACGQYLWVKTGPWGIILNPGKDQNSCSVGGNRQNKLHLESRTPSWAGLWTLSSCPGSMETTYQLENQTSRMEEPQGSYLDFPLPKRIP